MKSREMRALSNEKLLDLYNDKKNDMYVLRQQKTSGELKDTSGIRRTRRELARILTLLRERQLAAQVAHEEK